MVDGRFAKPASWPYNAPDEWRKVIAQGTLLPALDRIAYEIDLMCYDAEEVAEAWLALGATRLTFHAESTTDLTRLLASARTRYGSIVSYGAAINIASNLALIETSMGEIDYVQCMGIAEIGKQGQPFAHGVSNLVVGSGILRANNPAAEIAKFEALQSWFGV